MRQLDLFGTFFETPSQADKPEEKGAVAKKQKESLAAEETNSPSYSGNALRQKSFSADNSVTDKSSGAAIENTETGHTASAPSPLLLSLFDDRVTWPEPKSEIQEPEVDVDEIAGETEQTADGKEPQITVLIEPSIADEPQVSIIEERVEIKPAADIREPVAELKKKTPAPQPKKQQQPELERNGSVIFDNGKIAVKIKSHNPFPPPIVKEKKEKVKKLPQKRGRKSFKEIDAEVDLIEIPDDEILFQKQYYPISEVAKWFRVNTSLLRFWENEFDVLKPRKNRKGDRLFRPEDVKNLQLIYQLLRQRKYTIEGAKEYIKTNKKKADIQLQLTNTLQKFKSFLLDMKANLQ